MIELVIIIDEICIRHCKTLIYANETLVYSRSMRLLVGVYVKKSDRNIGRNDLKYESKIGKRKWMNFYMLKKV